MDLQNLSNEELTTLASDVQKEIETRRKERAQQLFNEFKERIKEEGYQIEDMLPAPAKKARGKARGKVPVKYRNPANKSETWTGRGRTPLWVRGKLENGAKLEDFLV